MLQHYDAQMLVQDDPAHRAKYPAQSFGMYKTLQLTITI